MVVDGGEMAALYGEHFRKNKAIIIFVLNYIKKISNAIEEELEEIRKSLNFMSDELNTKLCYLI